MERDWYRKRTWTDADQRDFRARLLRAREDDRSQYLRIQASTLAASDPKYLSVAIRLLDEVLNHHPQSLEVATALAQKAECLREMDDVEGAVDCYAASVSRMRAAPKMQTQDGWLDYGLLIAMERLSSKYDEALNLLEEFTASSPLMLPRDWFRMHASRALIFSELGEQDRAAEEANSALNASEQSQSGLQYHPCAGLVGDNYPLLRERLKKLVASDEGNSVRGGRHGLRSALKGLFKPKR